MSLISKCVNLYTSIDWKARILWLVLLSPVPVTLAQLMLDMTKYWYPFGVAIRLGLALPVILVILMLAVVDAVIAVLFMFELRALLLVKMKISNAILFNLLFVIIGGIYAFLSVALIPPIIAMWILKPLGLKLIYNAVRR